jgi:hypothetical protein
MPRKKKTNVPTETQSAEPKLAEELLDHLIPGRISQGEFELIYRALKKSHHRTRDERGETEHLGYRHGEPKLHPR